jgi:hypothetical protein
VPLGIFSIPGGNLNVQETRSGISSHADFGWGYGFEDHCYGARRRQRNDGQRLCTTTAYTVPQWLRTAATDAVSKQRSTTTTDALRIITAAYPQQST